MRVALAAVALIVLAAAGPTSLPAAQTRCPLGLLPLPRNAIAPSTAAVLRAVPRRDNPQVTGAMFAVHDRSRGPIARRQCGAAVWRRTVVVYVLRRAYLPSASASSGIYFVGRFRGGYRVWQVAH